MTHPLTQVVLTTRANAGGADLPQEVMMKRLLPFAILAALALSSIASAQHSRSAKKYVKRGSERFSKGDLAGAIKDYDRALEADPKLAEAYLNRGKARRAEGDLDGAIADYERVSELAPNLAHHNRIITEAYLNRGYIRSNRLDLDGALADYDRAIELDPQDADAYFKRGRALLIEGNLKFAIADFDKSISLNDRNPLVFAERGLAYQAQGHEAEAQKDFERGQRLNNDLRLMIDLHLMDLQLQIREMRRRQAASQKNIGRLTGYILPDAGSRHRVLAP